MDNNNQKLVPIIILIAILIFIAPIVVMVSPKWAEYQEKKEVIENYNNEKSTLEQKANSLEAERALADKKLKNLKTIYETNVDSSVTNTGKFGDLFNTIISKARSLGLLIYAVEYDLNPMSDPIASTQAGYNVCELKLTLVSSYNQLKAFLAELNNLNHLIFISKMNVSAFPENTDYILIKMSINLYSKKAGHVPPPPSGDSGQPFQQR